MEWSEKSLQGGPLAEQLGFCLTIEREGFSRHTVCQLSTCLHPLADGSLVFTLELLPPHSQLPKMSWLVDGLETGTGQMFCGRQVPETLSLFVQKMLQAEGALPSLDRQYVFPRCPRPPADTLETG